MEKRSSDVAAAAALERVDQDPPAQPDEGAENPPETHQNQSRSACGCASPPTRPMNSSSSVWPGPALAQLGDRRLRHQPPLGDHADVRRQPLDDLEDVRGQEDRAAARDERQQQLLDLPRRDRVDAFERLVEEQQPRRRQQRRRQRELLAHAVRVVGHQRVRRPTRAPSAAGDPPTERRRSPGRCRARRRRSSASRGRSADRTARDPRAPRRCAASRRPDRPADRCRECASSRPSAGAGR